MERDAKDSLDFRPAQAIWHPIVDRRHDSVVEHVCIQMDPVAASTLSRDNSDCFPRSGVGAEMTDLRETEGLQCRRERLAPVCLSLVLVTKSERHNVLIGNQRAIPIVGSQQRWTAACDERELRGGNFTVDVGLHLIEVHVAVQEQKAVATASLEREHRSKQDAAVPSQDKRKIAHFEDAFDFGCEPSCIIRDLPRVQESRFRIAFPAVGPGSHTSGLARIQIPTQARTIKRIWQLLDTGRPEAEDRRRLNYHDAAHTPSPFILTFMNNAAEQPTRRNDSPWRQRGGFDYPRPLVSGTASCRSGLG